LLAAFGERRLRHALIASAIVAVFAGMAVVTAQTQTPQFGGAYSGLDKRRQGLINDWVARFVKTTGQPLDPQAFYDDLLSLSSKTTFDAITHALMTTTLTGASGASLGDALALVEHVESVRGQVDGASGDRQFRMYVRLTPEAESTLSRSQQFTRGPDNTVFHKGYPASYRGQGGVPSVQFSIAQDGRRADIDVDYRSSSFPAALFNGHLTSSNSDVRAGSNYDKHINRWSGFDNWWRSFFGVRQQRAPDEVDTKTPLSLARTPRIGRKNIEVMVADFLTAWLIEGDIIASMGYISEHAYACLAQDSDNPEDFDRGLAPFRLMVNLKAAHDELGKRMSLSSAITGTRLTLPGLRVVNQPNHAQFVIYSVPDDVADAFDCESRSLLGERPKSKREYGNYFGATFYVDGRRDFPVALLWKQEERYWKIVSWQVGANNATGPDADPVAVPTPVRISADATLVRAARDFLENWLVRKDYDSAFKFIAPAAYACYDIERGEGQPPAQSPEDAARRIRAGLESSGKTFAKSTTLENILTAAEPIHPSTRVMDHPFARVFSLSSPPNALADAAECGARAAGTAMPDPLPLEYGNGYGMTVRFKTQGGDAPVLRVLWRQLNGAWRITSYGVELP
jgi:hypothetical protein